ncbi:MAG: DNA (cytosine-5-)-methyltransferase [Anaerolineae bacterium]
MPKSATSLPQKYHPIQHGPEIFPRRFILTTEEQQWRKSAISFLQEYLPSNNDASPVSTPPILKESRVTYEVTPVRSTSTAKKVQQKTLREKLTEILKTLRVVNEILKIQYGSPDWGNQPHIIDELVYILLTRRSKIEDARRHFEVIKERYPSWEEVICASPDELKVVIRGGGLEDHKVKFIQGSLGAIQQEFGRINETDFMNIPNEDLNKFLHKLPGVGPKSSACILMYAQNLDIFPADTHCIRVLDRLGLFKAFGFDWHQKNHKQAEKELLLLIPPHMRSDLHRNLLALGREICKPNPLCDSCELKKFCAYYRTKAQATYAEEKKSLAIDMFCGAGGFSLGLSRAGFKIVAAIDNNPDAIRTYRLNHPEMSDEAIMEKNAHQINLEKLQDLLRGQRLDLLVGGPPCQGFSMMGNRVPHYSKNGNHKSGSEYDFTQDDRNQLFEAMITLAETLQPRYVVIENVAGLKSAEIEEKSYADHISERLQTIKYQTKIVRLEATNLGIPQKRHRYFIIGIHHDAIWPEFECLEQIKPAAQLKHALFDLPPLSISDGRWIAPHTNIAAQQKDLAAVYLDKFQIRGQTKVLFSHVSRYNNSDDLELFTTLKEGESYRKLIARLGGKQNFTKYTDDNFPDKYYRLEWEGQSKTIVSHLHKDGNSFVHPDPDRQIRSISVREAARIQSFPDDYIFCGSRGAQFIQIGNAVPPVMSQAIGEVLMEAIRAQENGIGDE